MAFVYRPSSCRVAGAAYSMHYGSLPDRRAWCETVLRRGPVQPFDAHGSDGQWLISRNRKAGHFKGYLRRLKFKSLAVRKKRPDLFRSIPTDAPAVRSKNSPAFSIACMVTNNLRATATAARLFSSRSLRQSAGRCRPSCASGSPWQLRREALANDDRDAGICSRHNRPLLIGSGASPDQASRQQRGLLEVVGIFNGGDERGCGDRADAGGRHEDLTRLALARASNKLAPEFSRTNANAAPGFQHRQHDSPSYS